MAAMVSLHSSIPVSEIEKFVEKPVEKIVEEIGAYLIATTPAGPKYLPKGTV
jgi:hypothetical protein